MGADDGAVWWVRDNPPRFHILPLYSAVLEAVLNARFALLRHPLEPSRDDEAWVRALWQEVQKLLNAWLEASGWQERFGRMDLSRPASLLGGLNDSPESWEEWEARRSMANRFELLAHVISENDTLSARKEALIAALVLHEAFDGSPEIAIQGGVELRLCRKERNSAESRDLPAALRKAFNEARTEAIREQTGNAGLARGAQYDPLIEKIADLYHATRNEYPNRRAWLDDVVELNLELMMEQVNQGIRDGKSKLKTPDRDTIERWLRQRGLP